MTFEEFQTVIDLALEEIPGELLRDLPGGVVASPRVVPDPSGLPDTFRLGEYVIDPGLTGRTVYLYYGSFLRIFGHLSFDEMVDEVVHTLLHELRHHLERLRGTDELGEEDRRWFEETAANFGFRLRLPWGDRAVFWFFVVVVCLAGATAILYLFID